MLPLRAFLGVTFVFAGLQKLANPNFFNRASPISIWAQLAGAERTSPVHALLGHLLHLATPLGVLIAAGEVAIGLGILLGLLTRLAAAGGMLLSFGLFLTVSFHSNPYYTGADIVFFFALSPLLLAGPGPLLALDPVLRRRAIELSAARATWPYSRQGRGLPETRPEEVPLGPDFVLARRQLLSRAAVAAGTIGLVAMGLDSLIGRLAGGAVSPAPGAQLGAGAPAPTGAPTTGAPTTGAVPPTTRSRTTDGPASPSTTGGDPPSASTTGTQAAAGTQAAPPTSGATATPPGTALGPASDVPVGGAATFTDPASGDPGLVIQRTAGHFVAFDAVCPHAGCTVGYSASNNLIVCPCHGSEFDPSTGVVLAGPAPQGLRTIEIAEGANGQLYAV